MISYLSYETEQREIRIVPVSVLELDLRVKIHWTSHRNFSESFRISFITDTDTYDFLNFFEIGQDEINSKYIKCNLFLYHKEMRIHFMGCFPTSFNSDIHADGREEDMRGSEVEIHYDYFESHTLNETDKLLLLSQIRHKKNRIFRTLDLVVYP